MRWLFLFGSFSIFVAWQEARCGIIKVCRERGGVQVQDITQLKESAVERLDRLSREQLIKVMGFIDSLTGPSILRPLPTPDAFLGCAGTWIFEPGEWEEILKDIEQSRLMELEERHGVLFS
jgi:hypothetical protein